MEGLTAVSKADSKSRNVVSPLQQLSATALCNSRLQQPSSAALSSSSLQQPSAAALCNSPLQQPSATTLCSSPLQQSSQHYQQKMHWLTTAFTQKADQADNGTCCTGREVAMAIWETHLLIDYQRDHQVPILIPSTLLLHRPTPCPMSAQMPSYGSNSRPTVQVAA